MTMTTYVYRQGRLVEKPRSTTAKGPALHNFEAFRSPIDDRVIRSSREREIDLHRSGSYDPRDTPATFRKARDERYQQRRCAASEP